MSIGITVNVSTAKVGNRITFMGYKEVSTYLEGYLEGEWNKMRDTSKTSRGHLEGTLHPEGSKLIQYNSSFELVSRSEISESLVFRLCHS